jgi:hypothetical protein
MLSLLCTMLWLYYITSIMHYVTAGCMLRLLCTLSPLLHYLYYAQLVVLHYLYYALCYHWLYVTSIIHSVMLIVVCYLYYTLVLVNVVFVNVSQLLQSCNFGRFCAYELPAYVAFLLGFGVLAGTCTEE